MIISKGQKKMFDPLKEEEQYQLTTYHRVWAMTVVATVMLGLFLWGLFALGRWLIRMI